MDDVAVSIVAEIARKAVAGDYDILLAVRDIYDLRHRLPTVPSPILDAIADIASEVGELPIGSERQHWAADALREKDKLIANYREAVSTTAKEAMLQLLITIDKR